MVALAVRFVGQSPVTCNARQVLFRAHAALERGALIEAGCRLREAIRVYLVAECEWQECMPSGKAQRSPALLLKALLKAHPEFEFEWLWEILDYGNRLARCQYVRPGLIETSLAILHMYLDAASHLVQPKTEWRLP